MSIVSIVSIVSVATAVSGANPWPSGRLRDVLAAPLESVVHEAPFIDPITAWTGRLHRPTSVTRWRNPSVS